MGINPDAYMSGAIPGLSRGGSWQNVQDPHPSSTSQPFDSMSTGLPSGGSIYPRPSQIVPPGPSQIGPPVGVGQGNRSNPHFRQTTQWSMNPVLPLSPLSQQPSYTPSYQQSYFSSGIVGAGGSQASSTGYTASVGGMSMVSGQAPSTGPTRHPGWANVNELGGYRTSPSSPTPTAASQIQYSSHPHTRTPPRSATIANLHHMAMTPLVAGSNSRSTSIHQQREWEWDSGSPKPISAELDYLTSRNPYQASHPGSPSGEIPSHTYTPDPINLRLPSPKRRSRAKTTDLSQPQCQPVPPPPQSGRLRIDPAQRPAPKRRHTYDRFMTIEAENTGSQSSTRSLGKQRRKEWRDGGSIISETQSYYSNRKGSSSVNSPDIDPAMTASSFRNAATRSSTMVAGSKATSLTERRFKQTGRPNLPTIISAADSTASVVQSTGTERPALSLSELRDALPSASSPIASIPNEYESALTEEEDFDRYTAHPAVSVPPRMDITPGSSSATPPRRMEVKDVKPADYRPPAFPAPTKALAWNRDGPAMKTYGVAWKREAPDGQLPSGPAGPRWAQARPPRLDLQQTGNWWESGAG